MSEKAKKLFEQLQNEAIEIQETNRIERKTGKNATIIIVVGMLIFFCFLCSYLLDRCSAYKKEHQYSNDKAQILSVIPEYNILENDKLGLRITVNFKTENMKDESGLLVAYFYYNNNDSQVIGVNREFQDNSGGLICSKLFTSDYNEENVHNISLFIPYTEFGDYGQRTDYKFNISIAHKVNNTFDNFNLSEPYYFYLSNDYKLKKQVQVANRDVTSENVNNESKEWIKCDNCDGNGTIKTQTSCNDCRGTGKVTCRQCSGTGKWGPIYPTKGIYEPPTCSLCSGTGITICSYCEGTGITTSNKNCSKCNGRGSIFQ